MYGCKIPALALINITPSYALLLTICYKCQSTLQSIHFLVPQLVLSDNNLSEFQLIDKDNVCENFYMLRYNVYGE